MCTEPEIANKIKGNDTTKEFKDKTHGINEHRNPEHRFHQIISIKEHQLILYTEFHPFQTSIFLDVLSPHKSWHAQPAADESAVAGSSPANASSIVS